MRLRETQRHRKLLGEVIVKSAILWLTIFFCCAVPPSLGAAQEESVIEMKVRQVILDPYSKTPVVLLESSKEKRPLPIWIGGEEAASIALELESVPNPRPNTHDLIRNILRGVGAALPRITITDLRNNIYYATITLNLRGQEYQIDSRPSDAIAVALRMKAPIYATATVLAKAQPLAPAEKSKDDLRNTLGIQAQDLTPELAGLFDITSKSGILVADVEIGSPASQAGLQRGDVILKANDKAMQKATDLTSLLQGTKRGTRLKMEVQRKGSTVTVAVAVDLPS